MGYGKLIFDKLFGVNYDLSSAKGGFNSFSSLNGLSPAIVEGELSLVKDITLSNSIGDTSDLVFIGKYYSKTYDLCIIFIKSSNNRPYLFYRVSGNIAQNKVVQLPAPVDFPTATDWNGTQIDTRYYLQSYSSRKRYVIRFDSDENIFKEINLDINDFLIWKQISTYNYMVNSGLSISFPQNISDYQHIFFSFNVIRNFGGTYSKIKEYKFPDSNKYGIYIKVRTPSLNDPNNDSDVLIFASSAVGTNDVPEERLYAEIVSNVGNTTNPWLVKFSWVDTIAVDFINKDKIGLFADAQDHFGFLCFFCWFYTVNSLSWLIGAKLFIDEIEYTINNVVFADVTYGKEAYFVLDRNVHWSDTTSITRSFRIEIPYGSGRIVALPIYGNDEWGGLSVTYGDLISNYTDLSENIDSYGKACAYSDGLLFSGAVRFSNEDYINFFTNSYINNKGTRQVLALTALNLVSLGSIAGEMFKSKEKFQRVYFFMSESIILVKPNSGSPIVEDVIPINIVSKYHIAESSNGFYIYSGFKIYFLGFNGISVITGINSFLKTNNITNVYLSYNEVDKELLISDYDNERVFIYESVSGVWRNWLWDIPVRFVENYSYQGISYQISLDGLVFAISGTFASNLQLETNLSLEAFKTVDINEIRLNGSFIFSNLICELVLLDSTGVEKVVEMSVKHNKKEGILKLYRDESITIKEKVIKLKVYQNPSDTVSKFSLSSIEVYGNFEEVSGDYPDEVMTVISA